MVVECPSCNTKFSVDAGLIENAVDVRFHCSRCNHYFTLAEAQEEKERIARAEAEAFAKKAQAEQEAREREAQAREASRLAALEEEEAARTKRAEDRIQQLSISELTADKTSEFPSLESIAPVTTRAKVTWDEDDAELPLVTAEWPDRDPGTHYEVNLGGIYGTGIKGPQRTSSSGEKPDHSSAVPEDLSSPMSESEASTRDSSARSILWHNSSETTDIVKETSVLDTPLDADEEDASLDDEIQRIQEEEEEAALLQNIAADDDMGIDDESSDDDGAEEAADDFEDSELANNLETLPFRRNAIAGNEPEQKNDFAGGQPTALTRPETSTTHKPWFAFESLKKVAVSDLAAQTPEKKGPASVFRFPWPSAETSPSADAVPQPKTAVARRLSGISLSQPLVSGIFVASVPVLVAFLIGLWAVNFESTPAWAQQLLRMGESAIPDLPPAGLSIVGATARNSSSPEDSKQNALLVRGIILNGSLESFTSLTLETKVFDANDREIAKILSPNILASLPVQPGSALETQGAEKTLSPNAKLPFELRIAANQAPSWFTTRVYSVHKL